MILRQIPNIITLFRLLAVGPFIMFLLNEQYDYALYLFTAAGLSDGVDGILARRFGWTSRFGSLLDPFADKLLMVSSFLALTYLGKLQWWVSALVIVRDLVILGGVGGLFCVFKNVQFHPTRVSKLNTVLQIVFILLQLYELAFHNLPEELILGVLVSMIITTVWSFIDYVWVWSHKAYQEWQ